MHSDNRAEVAELLVRALVVAPASKVRQLSAQTKIAKGLINSVLYSRRDLFESVGPQPPDWYLRPGVSTSPAVPDVVSTEAGRVSDPGEPALYAWQRDALAAWVANGGRGIVEAVTGAGKTRVGLGAIGAQLERGGRAAVLVPTIELLHQWYEELATQFPGAAIGRLGDGYGDLLDRNEVLVATAASARRWDLGLPEETEGLLVADECHRYGAAVTQHALEPGFARRLGLSATYERPDGAHETILKPYFEGVVFTLDYQRAVREDVVAPVRVALLGVSFSSLERSEYEELSEAVSKARTRLVLGLGVPGEPFAEFIAEVHRLTKYGTREQGMAAGRFLRHWQARRALMAETPAKLSALDRLIRSLSDADRSLVFTQTKASADDLAARLRAHGVSAAAHHSGISKGERTATLDSFRAGQLKVVTAAQTLNEGVDVPEADLAVIMAASSQRREMIQRMGRVLRRKPDGRAARFVLVYVRDTPEDPAQGAHEAFFDDLLAVAEATRTFDDRSSQKDLDAFLAP